MDNLFDPERKVGESLDQYIDRLFRAEAEQTVKDENARQEVLRNQHAMMVKTAKALLKVPPGPGKRDQKLRSKAFKIALTYDSQYYTSSEMQNAIDCVNSAVGCS